MESSEIYKMMRIIRHKRFYSRMLMSMGLQNRAYSLLLYIVELRLKLVLYGSGLAIVCTCCSCVIVLVYERDS